MLAGTQKSYCDPVAHRRLFVLLLLLFACSVATFGQDEDDDVAPPPLKLLSQPEKTRLGAETEVKRRTRLALELMDARLLRAETLAKSESFDEMFSELGGFHGLMDNMLEFLNKS